MFRRFCLLVLLALPTAYALQHPGALEADEPAEAPAGQTLLERLSAETVALAQRGASASAHLVSAQGVWLGALVGEPARFVMALDPGVVAAELPRTARLLQVGQPQAEATLLDADGELGLALYAIAGTARAGLVVASASALRRGTLAVVADAAQPRLVSLGTSEGPLEDLLATETLGGVALLAPGGALLGLATSGRAAAAQGCVACHVVDGSSSSLLGDYRMWRGSVLDLEGTSAWGELPAANGRSSGLFVSNDGGGSWRRAHPDTATIDAVTLVPAPVVERALEDLTLGRRLARAYLGVVPDGTTVDRFVIGSSDRAAQERVVRLLRVPGARVEARIEGHAASLPGTHAGFVRLAQVIADSPAARAGLRGAQDVLTLDGVSVRGATHFARMLARRRPGETVRLGVRGLAEPVSIVLGDREKEGRSLATASSVGLEAQALTADLSAFLGVALGEGGVVVRSTTSDGAAAQAGLRHGDVILEGGGGPIRDRAELDAVLGAAREAVLLVIERQGQRLTVTLNPPKMGTGLLPR